MRVCGSFADVASHIALNLLTPEVVRQAVAEVKTGRHIQLDWSLDNLTNPGFGRIPLNHRIKDLQEHGFVALDDEITINTQTGSQWDSLKHVRVIHLANKQGRNIDSCLVWASKTRDVLQWPCTQRSDKYEEKWNPQ